MINIGICDDDLSVAVTIEEMLYEIGKEKHILLTSDVYSDGTTLLESIYNGHHYDLLYLDIEMKKMNGIRVASEIRDREMPLIIVYVSSYEKYLKELLFTEPFAFISKPFNKEEFFMVFQKVYKRLSQKPEYFPYTYNKADYKLPISKITYFESYNRIVYIHMAGEKQRLSLNAANRRRSRKGGENVSVDSVPIAEEKFYGKINDVEKRLNGRFIRIHQSFLVNFDYIKSMSFNEVTLMDNTVLQISDDRQKKARQQFCAMIGMESRHDK